MKVNNSAPIEVTTLSIWNAEATISAMTTHLLHASKFGALLGFQHQQFGHPRMDVTSYMEKKGLLGQQDGDLRKRHNYRAI